MEFPVRIPFVEHLGFELLHRDPGASEIAIEIREELTNSLGVAHGGLLMTLLDIAMAQAARSPAEAGAELLPGVVTIEMKSSFMRPGVGRLVATGRRLHRSLSMAFCEASARDARGRLVAHATGTFKYLRSSSSPASAALTRRADSD